MSTHIGIVGAGAIGQSFARQLLKAGYRVTISNSRGPESLAPLVRELGSGVQAGTVKEAASAEIVILAVPWKHLREVTANVPTWEGRIVVDATNPIINPGFTVADLGGRTSSEVVADLLPGARLVKAGNTLPAEVLAADPREGTGRPRPLRIGRRCQREREGRPRPRQNRIRRGRSWRPRGGRQVAAIPRRTTRGAQPRPIAMT